MKRPRNHIIQTISNKAFAGIIPDEWAARELSPDYGLDFMLEIFTDEESTGKILFVQLKGTDDEPETESITYQIKRSHLEYYSSIPNPILFVIFSIPSNLFWAVWTNNLKDFLEKKKDDQESSLLRLSKQHIIDKSYFKELPKIFSFDLPDKINITFESNGRLGEQYNSKLLGWLKEYFPNSIIDNNSQITQNIHFRYNHLDEENFEIQLDYLGNKHILGNIQIKNKNFLLYPVDNYRVVDNSLINPLVYISLLLSEKDIKGSISLLLKCIENYNGELFTPENLLKIGINAIENGHLNEFQKLIKKFIESNKFKEFQFLNMILMSRYNDEESRNYYQENLRLAIAKFEDKRTKGILNYNLANSLRASNELYLSSLNYQQARKNEPKYLEKPYWWFEYAGVLFLSNHFKYAEYFYKKSKELGIETIHGNLINCLIGDCLFYQGKFTKAKGFFETYMKQAETIPDIYFLKFDVCRNMILADLDEVEFDIENSNKILEEAINAKSIELLSDAIAKYPLNALAWYNYGAATDLGGEPKLAFMAYLTSCCISEWDIEAWKNCFLISWNFKRMEKILIFYKIILERFGLASVNYIADHILSDPKLEENVKLELIEGFNKIAKELIKPAHNSTFAPALQTPKHLQKR